MKNRYEIVTDRKCGLRYFDRAVAKIGRQAVIDTIRDILQRYCGPTAPNGIRGLGFRWAFGNAIIQILDPKGDICQSYNSDEALTQVELQALITEFTLDPQATKPTWDRTPVKPGQELTDTDILRYCEKAIAGITRQDSAPNNTTVFPSEREDSTATCKKLLAAAYAGTPASNAKQWKRTSKHKDQNNNTVRTFRCDVTKEKAIITISPNGSVIEKYNDDIETRLIAAGNTIRHCGDYGNLYWNPFTKQVWWTMADSDGEDPGSDEIENTLSIPGVANVNIGCECSPPGFDNEDEDENEEAPHWKHLGICGITTPLIS